jgi:gliding motility-associated-like protein
MYLKRIATLLSFLFFANIAKSQIDFSPSVKKGCSPLLVNFTETHNKNIVKRFWDFGNTATSTLENPGTIYTKSGKYTVSLITEDINGAKDTIIYKDLIEVYDNPRAFFETNRNSYCVGDPVNIIDRSTVVITGIRDYLWDFGDGRTYNSKTPNHSYNTPGNYTVTLLVTDSNGCRSTHRETFFYRIGNLPKVDFTTDKTINCGLPLNVKFNPIVGGGIRSYIWDFGDGKNSTTTAPSHNYDTIGSFNVRLTIVDSNGCLNSITKPNLVENLKLKAEFKDFSEKLCDNESVTFTNLSQPTRSDVRYRWEFGDGTISSQFQPVKKYTQSGNYTIKLYSFILNTQCIDSFIINKRIDIIKTQNIVPIISDTVFCQLPKRVFFEPSDTVSSAFWKFTNSPFDTSSLIRPSFLFTSAGNFNIAYEFRDTNGCLIKGVKIGGVRVTTQTIGISGVLTGCVPRTETFRLSTNSSNITNYFWYLDDSLVSTSPSFRNTFTKPGTGRIRLTVVTNQGCEYSRTVNYNYGGRTKVDFFPVKSQVCFNETIKFVIVPDSNSAPITSSQWIFENQTNSTGENKFTEFKSQRVILITRNGTCADTTEKIFEIGSSGSAIRGPVSRIGINYDTCGRKLIIDNRSIAYTSHRWHIDWDGNPKYNISSDNNRWLFNLDDSSQNFTIRLTTFNDSNDCPADTSVINLKTVSKLFSSFSFEGDFCAPAEVKFTNTSNYTSTDTFLWFVNGQRVQSTGTNDETPVSSSVNIDYTRGETGRFSPLFKFGNSGEYEVMMIGRRGSCLDTVIQVINTTGPIVKPGAIPSDQCIPLSITLVDSLYKEGKKSLWVIANKDSIIPTSKFTNWNINNINDSGKLKIKYVEWDERGCITWKIINLPINSPSVNFSHKLVTTCDSAFIEFTPIVGNVGVNEKLFYFWDFGDSTNFTFGESNLENQIKKLTHRYSDNKTYTVEFVVTDEKGCFSSIKHDVDYFEELLKADFIADTSGVFCPPVKVGFKNASRSASPIIRYFWEFGDGTTASSENPEKVFTFPGRFSVKLTIENAAGCIDSVLLPDFLIINGPVGEFEFDREFGCVPLEVGFKLTTNSKSNIALWDMGDGSLSTLDSFRHIYDRPGNFYPMIILKDTFGCEFIIPRDKKITVYPNPVVDFEVSKFCFGDSVYLSNTSILDENQNYEFYWYLGDSIMSNNFNWAIHINDFKSRRVSLVAKSNIGCDDSISKIISIRSFNPDIKILNNNICLGDTITIINNTIDDHIVKYEWNVANEFWSSDREIKFIPLKSGWYDIQLYMQNNDGCDTTLFFERYAFVRDTMPHKNPKMLSVSVSNNTSVEIKHKKSNEDGFKSYIVYRRLPDGRLMTVRESTNRNDTFLVEGGLNTLNNVYCYTVVEKNTCEYTGRADDSLFHCTIDVVGTPDINASIVTWNAYYGWDAVNKYEIYRKSEQFGGDFAKIGEVPGDSLKFIDTSMLCRSAFFYRILAYDKFSNEVSWSDTCRVMPIYINNVPAPEFLLSSILDNRSVELYWNSPLNSRNAIVKYEIERSVGDQNNYQLLTSIGIGARNYWIDSKNIDVNSNNYYYRIRALDLCGDWSDYGHFTRPVLLKSTVADDFKPLLYWTHYKKWEEGVLFYEIQQLVSGQFIKIGETLTGDDTVFIHHDVVYNCFYPYEYRVVAVKNTNDYNLYRSYSNNTDLEFSPKIYTPNAFSPNGDGLNDVYEVKGIFVKSINLKIFNRWGEKLHETNDCMPTWDGIYRDAMSPDGVYVAIIEAIGIDNKVYRYKTSLTLIK